ncbi:hypothetical protein [Micromonospora fulviviridis]|uniref:Uncharacterized protein n=1 Tax=Micromonospora fulviviridis TaxID=47860 RepID=A0ABV2VTN8_9ACTN
MRRLNTLLASDLSTQDTVRVLNLLLSLERERVQLYGLRLPASVVVSIEQAAGQ